VSYFHSCPCCSAPNVERDFRLCGACSGLVGQSVNTPEGYGRVVSIRPHGSILVQLSGDRHGEFSRAQLTVEDLAPIAAAVPELSPGLCPEEETARALGRIEREEDTRLDRVWKANRLELLLRPWPAWVASH
jgi:hypothetical protein